MRPKTPYYEFMRLIYDQFEWGLPSPEDGIDVLCDIIHLNSRVDGAYAERILGLLIEHGKWRAMHADTIRKRHLRGANQPGLRYRNAFEHTIHPALKSIYYRRK